MDLACSNDRQQTFGKLFANSRLRPKANFTPLHSRSDGTLGAIVCRFNAIVFKEGEKMLPVVKQSLCTSLYSLIGTVKEDYTEIVHPVPEWLSVNRNRSPGL